MANFTDYEIQVMDSIAEQWGSREDFEAWYKQRSEAPKQEEKVQEVAPVVEEQDLWQISSPIPSDTKKLSLGGLTDMVEQQKTAEQEQDEWLKGFISETWEALGKRWATIKEALSTKQAQVTKSVEDDGALWALKEILKTTPIWIPISITKDVLSDKDSPELQIAWQVIAGTWDIIWEWVENLVQDATPEEAEKVIEGLVSKVGESQTVQDMAKSYADFKEKNPERARNIEWLANVSQILPIGKAKNIIQKPFSKTAARATAEWAEQSLKDTGRALLNIPWKTTPKETLDITKFFADKVKPTELFDDIVTQFDDLGWSSIKQLDNNLKGITKTFKPKGAKEVLSVIKENLEKGVNNKSMPFSKGQLNDVKQLLKKLDSEWLTLTELNKIKRSISDYTKAWTSAGKEAAWVSPEAMRWKYTEVMKFIENSASREWVKNVRELNQNWIKSNTLSELLGKQSTSIGKKKWMQSLQKWSVLTSLGTKIRQLREDLGLSDAIWAVGLEDIDLSKALETIKKISKKTETKTIQETLKNKLKR